VGIYTYTDWQDNLPMQLYNREKVAAAMDTIRDKGAGPTPLKIGLQKLDKILEPLKGRTAVFVFWDGEFTGRTRSSGQGRGQEARRLLLRDQQREAEA
jgi:hypothetical protein